MIPQEHTETFGDTTFHLSFASFGPHRWLVWRSDHGDHDHYGCGRFVSREAAIFEFQSRVDFFKALQEVRKRVHGRERRA